MFRLLVVMTVLLMTTDAMLVEGFWANVDIFSRLFKIINTTGRCPPSVHLTNIDNVIYYGTINIGIPQQKFKVVFDTTTPYSRIFSKKCTTLDFLAGSQCESATLNPYIAYSGLFRLPYLDYNVTGFISTGTFNVAHLNIQNQSFLEVANISDQHILESYLNITYRKYDGLLGLSYYKTFGPIRSILENMIKQGLVSSRIFGLYLNRNASSDFGGKLSFGESDPAYYEGNFTYVPVIRRDYWQFIIDGIEIDEFMWCEESCRAIVDTSTWKIIGPKTDVSLIYRIIRINSSGSVNCSKISHLPTITFILRGKAFDLTGKDYTIRNPDNKSECISVFRKNEATYKYGVEWVLGMPFIGRYYTKFDMERNRLGFALAKKNL